MKKLLLLLFSISFLNTLAQELHKNSISTSLIRMETNSQTRLGDHQLKFVTGIEYQRAVNKWSFGIKYEHGFNKIEEYPTDCYDCFFGTGYMREDNVYLTSNYSIFSFFNARLKINAGIALYYSNLNFSGDYQGGFSGGGTKTNSTYNTFGLAPSISVIYYPIKNLFISLNTNTKYGWGYAYDAPINRNRKLKEFAITAPELRIGVSF